jgi:hypothetical protein
MDRIPLDFYGEASSLGASQEENRLPDELLSIVSFL